MNRSLQTDWLEDARFGLFVHFGLYSIPAGVWHGQRMGRNDYAEWIRMQHNWPAPGGIPRAEYDTLNHSWGYHRLDYNWKPARQLLRHLVDNASRGGNYQLNVGPTGAGVFQPAAIRRLREIGAWMAANGEAVHGTRPAPYPEPAWGRLTWKPAAATSTPSSMIRSPAPPLPLSVQPSLRRAPGCSKPARRWPWQPAQTASILLCQSICRMTTSWRLAWN